MSEEEHHRRSEDSPFRIWGPIVTPLIAVGIAWGATTTQLNSISAQQQTLVVDVRDLKDTKSRQEVIIDNLQRTVVDSKVDSNVMADMARDLGVIHGRLAALEDGLKRNWPRDRAQDTNIETLARVLEKLEGSPIKLRIIEDF